MSTAAGSPPHSRRKWLLLGVVGVAQLMIILDALVVNIALPYAQATLHLSNTDRQWVVTAYSLTFGGFLLLGGRVSDYLGRKRIFLVGLLGFAAASAVGGAAPTSAWLFGARAFQGVFAALLAPTVLSVITTTFTEPRERARAFGVYGAIGAAGAALGMIVGGALTEYLNWRWTLFVNAPIAVVVAVAGVPLLVESRTEGERRYDVIGAALGTSGLAALVYGFSEASIYSWTSAHTIVACAAGLCLLAGFVAREGLTSHPMLPLRIVLDHSRGGSYLGFFLASMGISAPFLFLTYYFEANLGYSPLKTGLMFLPFPFGVTMSSAVASRLLPRVGPRVLASAGFLLAAAGMVVLTSLSLDSSYWGHIVPAELIMSVGLGHIFVPLSATALSRVPHGDAGSASALLNTVQQVGSSIGNAFLNTVATSAAAHYAGAAAAAAVYGYTRSFVIAACVFLSGALAGAGLLRTRVSRADRDDPALPVKESGGERSAPAGDPSTS